MVLMVLVLAELQQVLLVLLLVVTEVHQLTLVVPQQLIMLTNQEQQLRLLRQLDS